MKTSKKSLILFDTNILVYNQVQESTFYFQASAYHEKVFSGTISAVLSSQNLLEFTSVMLSPKKIIKPLSQSGVRAEIAKYHESGFFQIIFPTSQTISIFHTLLAKYRLKNPVQSFDLFLVATMLTHRVRCILTENKKDFPFDEIEVLSLNKVS